MNNKNFTVYYKIDLKIFRSDLKFVGTNIKTYEIENSI